MGHSEDQQACKQKELEVDSPQQFHVQPAGLRAPPHQTFRRWSSPGKSLQLGFLRVNGGTVTYLLRNSGAGDSLSCRGGGLLTFRISSLLRLCKLLLLCAGNQ